ncbi:MAG TPA: GAF domain-containing SpoIIE family protein phosphatase [Streptosporangiaceae bacterium]|nr:GAF domain-containing SpoIIE family protein phosphatase [Streptosporangiaceae bacterium]
MGVAGSARIRVPAGTVAVAGPVPVGSPGLPEPASARWDDQPDTPAEDPFERVAWLARVALGTPWASVTLAGGRSTSGSVCLPGPGMADRQRAAEVALCQYVTDHGCELIIGATGRDQEVSGGGSEAPASLVAWAGLPVRGPDGRVVGTLCVADDRPRQWSSRDAGALRALANVAASEVALRAALRLGAERAALAQTLQESLLPPRLPEIPGMQVAARYTAGGTGAEVLGDFYDVFPSVRGNWGIAVGDVCGKGAPAAKSTALARYTLRAEAHRETRPAVILATLNQALLDWMTDDPRFLTAIYATVRPTAAGASVRISSGGHPLALLHRANGHVQAVGQPGTLLGLLPDPELHDSRCLLRAGDSLIFYTDGVTEARSQADHSLYGDSRLHELITSLGTLPAPRTADAIQQAVLRFSGGKTSDDTVTLVLTVPQHQTHGQPGHGGT